MIEECIDRRKPRGRPQGTGKDDTVDLAAVADMVVASEGGARTVSASSAMKRCVKGIGDSHLRRLQVKWKAHGDSLKEEARGRIRARNEAREKARRAMAPGFGASHYAQIAALAATGMQNYDALTASSHLQSVMAMTKLVDSQAAAFGAGGIAEFIARDAAMRETYSKMMGPSGLLGAMDHSAAAAAILGTTLPSSAAMSELARSMGVLDQVSSMAESPTMKAMRELGESLDRADPTRWLR